MSYASVAAQNAPPPSQQPQADPTLLNTTAEATELPSVDQKVTVAPADYKEHPKSAATRIGEELEHAAGNEGDDEGGEEEGNVNGSSKRRARKEKARKAAEDAEKEGLELWNVAKHTLLRPGVAGGLLGIVNVGILSTIGYKLYTEPGLRKNTQFLSISAASTLALFGSETYLAEAYRRTEAGQEEEKRAREEGAIIYKHARNVILRPGVLGGLVGVLNVGILGGVGCWSYHNWDRPVWDRRAVTVAAVGIATLFAGEGYLGELYREKELPKQK